MAVKNPISDPTQAKIRLGWDNWATDSRFHGESCQTIGSLTKGSPRPHVNEVP